MLFDDRSRSMDTTVFSLRTSSSRSSLSTRQSSCSSLNRCSNVCSITVRSCRSFVDVSNCAAIMSRSLRRDSAAASTSASLPRQPCAASSRRTMVSEYPTHSAMSSSIFPDSRAFSSPNIAFSFWYLLTSWFLWDARCAAVVSSRILACIFLVSLASLSCISLTSSSARAALARASSSDRLDSRVSETCLSSVSFSASSSCVWRFIKRSASSARDREASASRSSESSVRAPPRSSVSICSSNTSSSRSFFSTEAEPTIKRKGQSLVMCLSKQSQGNRADQSAETWNWEIRTLQILSPHGLVLGRQLQHDRQPR